ncbi:helix-turn-helix domain-containing protein [Brucella endophytica]|nr:helix-turn-helix domain-containing protein [Brucella endophytica]
MPQPLNWRKPAFNSRDYWFAVGNGWITDEEYEADLAAHEERVKRAKASQGKASPPPARWQRQAPQATRQYANPMSTEAARDDRLTPQAKALLQVIRARCGKHGRTETTKFTLASIMSRSVRSIQRYIGELIRFGYIVTRTRTGRTGLYTGLVIEITAKVLPYWTNFEKLAADLAGKLGADWVSNRVFSDETKLSSKNHHLNYNIIPMISGERAKRTHFNLFSPDSP